MSTARCCRELRSERGAIGVALLIAGAVVAAQPDARPAIPDVSGRVLTVSGPVDPSSLGQTLMHEHVFIDYKPLVDPTPRFASAAAAEHYDLPFTIDTLHAARYGQGLRTRRTDR